MHDDTTLILPLPSRAKPKAFKLTATARDAMRFYCDDPLLGRWRAEQHCNGIRHVGHGHDMASARKDLMAQRERMVTR